MSEKINTSPACTRCKKELLTHLLYHSLKAVGANGSLEIDCHPEPHAKVGDALKYVLETRASAMLAQGELKTALKKHAEELANKVGDAERRAASAAQTKAVETAVADFAAKEALHKKALEDCERTRVVAESTHTAKVTNLEDVLKEVRGDKQTLLDEKRTLAGKLAASEKNAFDLQLEVDELKEELREVRRQHEDLKQEAKDVLRLAFTIGSHATTLGRKLGIDGEAGIEKLFAKPADPRPPIEVEDRTRKATAKPVSVVPPTVPTPAPKAEVVTANVAVPEAAPAPVPQTVTVVLDAPTPESESSASADDEDDGYDGSDESGEAVDDDGIIEEMRADSVEGDVVSSEVEEEASEDDDVSSEVAEPEECRGCNEAATHGFTYVTKDGTTDRMVTCDPSEHTGDFLSHLLKTAAADRNTALKRMPKNAEALERLFKANLITPNP